MKSKIFTLLLLFSLFLSQKSISQGIMSPGGLGAWGNMVYLGGAFTYPSPLINKAVQFSAKSDAAGSFGFGFGDPVTGIGVQVGSGMFDVTHFNLYNFGLKFHRYFGKGISAGIGVENLLTFSDSIVVGKANNINEYVAFTKDFSYTEDPNSLLSKLSISLGIGVGRFSKLSAADQITHKRENGTYTFGALQYKAYKGLSVHAEWTGTNANAGVSFTGKINNLPITIVVCAADLTKYSGNGARLVAGIGLVYQVKEHKTSENRLQQINLMITQNMMQNNINIVKDSLGKQITDLAKQVDELKRFQSTQNSENQKIDEIQKNFNDLKANLTQNQTATSELNNGNNASVTNNAMNAKTNAKKEIKTKNKAKSKENKAISSTKEISNYSNNEVVMFDSLGNKSQALGNGMYVILYAFQYKENAEKALKLSKSKGIEGSIVYNSTKNLYYLYSKKYSSLKDARTQRSEQINNGFEGAWILILR